MEIKVIWCLIVGLTLVVIICNCVYKMRNNRDCQSIKLLESQRRFMTKVDNDDDDDWDDEL